MTQTNRLTVSTVLQCFCADEFHQPSPRQRLQYSTRANACEHLGTLGQFIERGKPACRKDCFFESITEAISEIVKEASWQESV